MKLRLAEEANNQRGTFAKSNRAVPAPGDSFFVPDLCLLGGNKTIPNVTEEHSLIPQCTYKHSGVRGLVVPAMRLKIRRPERVVGVQVPLPAPNLWKPCTKWRLAAGTDAAGAAS